MTLRYTESPELHEVSTHGFPINVIIWKVFGYDVFVGECPL